VITGAGPDYWAAIASAVTSAEVDNGPPASDIIGLSGGPSSGTQTITFDSAVVDPVMAIFSLGQAAVTATFDFEDDFDILNDGSSVAGSSGLTELAGYVLEGAEGHGLIRFNGTFTSISWTVPTYEYWAGFQIGVAVPAPASLPLFALALAALAVGRRRISA
jgi:hypothetical protein